MISFLFRLNGNLKNCTYSFGISIFNFVAIIYLVISSNILSSSFVVFVNARRQRKLAFQRRKKRDEMEYRFEVYCKENIEESEREGEN